MTISRSVFSLLCTIAAACGGQSDPGHADTPDAAAAHADAKVTSLVDGEPGCGANADCAANEFCDWEPAHACGADHARGTCVAFVAHPCPDLGFWVCGCDGATYLNECHSTAHGTDVAYGGPCRDAGANVACILDADCPQDPEFPQFCETDDQACDPTTTRCPGICAHGTYVCGPDQPCLSETGGISPGTEICVKTTDPGDSGQPGRCIYTTAVPCTSNDTCDDGEVCMTHEGCDPASGTPCVKECVRP